jgi:hypothetical protein
MAQGVPPRSGQPGAALRQPATEEHLVRQQVEEAVQGLLGLLMVLSDGTFVLSDLPVECLDFRTHPLNTDRFIPSCLPKCPTSRDAPGQCVLRSSVTGIYVGMTLVLTLWSEKPNTGAPMLY